jgi:FKBP-type peptidyl-prolyl cis-trans isomerase SlyD
MNLLAPQGADRIMAHMQIAPDSVVTLHYSVATAEGEEIDRSTPEQPLCYLHGHGNIIPGLEKRLTGQSEGAKFSTEIPPEEAYGVSDPGLDLVVPLDAFPPEARPRVQPGFRFQAERPGQAGGETVFTVVKVEGQEAWVTGNHMLAGKTLLFQIEVLSVRPASAEELAHGHVHGPHGHHH